jgi:hypothetical protein
LIDLKRHSKGSEVRRDCSLAAAHPSTRCAIRCTVDALTVGVAPGRILACGALVPTDEPQGVAADDHEAVARRGGEEGRGLQIVTSTKLVERGV